VEKQKVLAQLPNATKNFFCVLCEAMRKFLVLENLTNRLDWAAQNL
jgi:hypothetical protein